MGRSQIKRLDENNRLRSENLALFLKNLDPAKYQTDFETAGSCNYAFTLVLKRPDPVLCDNVMKTLDRIWRRISPGHLRRGESTSPTLFKTIAWASRTSRQFPNVEHIHFYGFYIGNYPGLEREKILALCSLLNSIKE